MKFRTYKRRDTTRQSGYHVSGETSGSQAIIIQTDHYADDKANNAKLVFEHKAVEVVELFDEQIGLIAYGAYIYPEVELKISCQLTCSSENNILSWEFEHTLAKNEWSRVGNHAIIPTQDFSGSTIDIKCSLTFESMTDTKVDFHIAGFDLDSVNFKHFISNPDAYFRFQQKTHISVPELFYLTPEKPITEYLVFASGGDFSKDKYLIFKSCNRCSRYLPIDVENERNTLSFSNHCMAKAPCTHNAFSKYTIMEENLKDLKSSPSFNKSKWDEISKSIKNGIVQCYFGHQLECKACKKFFVNAPLNCLRTTTQHREDSLRRRSIEVLVDTLLGNDWIYHKFRKENKKEFDDYIWEKFGGKCFKCGKKLPKNGYDLDHTMPLAYLWPLDETATILCKTHNSQKNDSFPVDYYTAEELDRLAIITGIDNELLHSRCVNQKVLKELIEKVDWFFDTFLEHKDYQKVRDGKRTSDLIFRAIQKVINTDGKKIDLIYEYNKKTGKYPQSITLETIK